MDDDEASSSKSFPIQGESIQISEMEMLFDDLKKLGEELDEGIYTDDHDQTINLIISGIKELNGERRELHESLEVLTISTSKKRNALQTLPKQYNKHMKDAVLSVREKVEKEVEEKKKLVKICWTEKHQAEVTYKELSDENQNLQPQNEQAKLEHDRTIHALNNHINDKAETQIYLKETIETIHEVKQRTNEYEVGVENLTQDLEEYTNKSEQETNQILKEIEELEKVIDEQNRVNLGLKKIDDEIAAKLMEATIQRESELKKLKHLQTSNEIMKSERMQVENDVKEKIPQNEELTHTRDYLCGAYDQLHDEFDSKIKKTTAKKDLVFNNFELNEAKRKELEEKQEKSKKRSEELEKVKSELQVVEREQTEYSAEIKEKLEEYGNKLDNMQLKNREMETKLEGSKSKHDNFVEMTKQRIAQYQKDLKYEKKEKEKSQQKKTESDKELKEYQEFCNNYVEDVMKKIAECKNSYRSAVEETHELTRETRLNRRKNDQFSKEVELYRKKSVREREEWLIEIERLLDHIDSLKTTNHKNQLIRDERSEIVHELRSSLQHETEVYQKAKLEVIAARGLHKNKLKEEEEMGKMSNNADGDIHNMKLELNEKTSKVTQQLAEFDQVRKDVDLKIYNRLNLAEKINSRNELFVQKLKENMTMIEKLKNEMERYKNDESVRLKTNLNNVRTNLWDHFNECKKMEEKSTENDERTIEEMKELEKFLTERTTQANTILMDMQYVLQDYTQFINKVQSKRPKSTSRPRKHRTKSPIKKSKAKKEANKNSTTKNEIISDIKSVHSSRMENGVAVF